jgi:hypothetical protein
VPYNSGVLQRFRSSDVAFAAPRVYAGVKQVPAHELIEGKTYMFFSHTIKGQEANMPLLQACLDKKVVPALDSQYLCSCTCVRVWLCMCVRVDEGQTEKRLCAPPEAFYGGGLDRWAGILRMCTCL